MPQDIQEKARFKLLRFGCLPQVFITLRGLGFHCPGAAPWGRGSASVRRGYALQMLEKYAKKKVKIKQQRKQTGDSCLAEFKDGIHRENRSFYLKRDRVKYI